MADDLWAELQAAEQVERQKNHNRISSAGPRASTLNALSEKTKKKSKKKKDKDKAKKKKKKRASVSSPSISATAKSLRGFKSPVLKTPSASVTVQLVIPEEERNSVDKVLLRVQRHINELSSEELGKRKSALTMLSSAIFLDFSFDAAATHLRKLVDEMHSEGSYPQSSSISTLGFSILPADVLSELLFGHLLKPLVRRFTDPSEYCREMAILLLAKMIAHVDDFTRAFPYVFPALRERVPNIYFLDTKQGLFVEDRADYEARIRGRVTEQQKEALASRYGKTSVIEPAEEVRLRLSQILWIFHYRALLQDSQAQIYPYVEDSAILLQAAVLDPFAEVKVLACEVIRLLSQSVPVLWKVYCPAFVRRLMPQLAHRHARIRVAILDAIDACVQCEDKDKCRGAGSEAINDLLGHRDANVLPIAAFYGADVRVNRFAKLAIDGNVAVRRRFIKAVTDWAHDLPDRIDHQAHLLPYLLGALHDDNPAVRDDALEHVDKMGRQYEKEHQKEVLDRKQYGFDGDSTLIHGSLPPPFNVNGRPPIGSRLFVRHWARRFLKPVLAELGAWQRETRINAAYMFRTIVIYMEDHISMSLTDVIKAVLKFILDPDVGDIIQETASYLGRFILPMAWVDLLLPHITGEKSFNPNSSSISQASAVLFVTKMAKECSPARLLPSFTAILEALDPRTRHSIVEPFFLGLSPAPTLANATRELVRVLSSALRRCGASGAAQEIFTQTGRLHDVDKINRRLFRLQILAASKTSEDLAAAKHLNDADSITSATAALQTISEGILDLGHCLNSVAGLGLEDDAARTAAFEAHVPLLAGDAAIVYESCRSATHSHYEVDVDVDALDVANRIVGQLVNEIPTEIFSRGPQHEVVRSLVGAIRAAMAVQSPQQWLWVSRQVHRLVQIENEVISKHGSTCFSGLLASHLLDAAATAVNTWLEPFIDNVAPSVDNSSKGIEIQSSDQQGSPAASGSVQAMECFDSWLNVCVDTSTICSSTSSLASAAACACLAALKRITVKQLNRQASGAAAAFSRHARTLVLNLLKSFEVKLYLPSDDTATLFNLLGLGLNEPDDTLLKATIHFILELLRPTCRIDTLNKASKQAAVEMFNQALAYTPIGRPLPTGERLPTVTDLTHEEVETLWPILAATLVVAFGDGVSVEGEIQKIRTDLASLSSDAESRDLKSRLEQLVALQSISKSSGSAQWAPRHSVPKANLDESVNFSAAIDKARAEAKAATHEPKPLGQTKLNSQLRESATSEHVDVDAAIHGDEIDDDDECPPLHQSVAKADTESAVEDDYVVVSHPPANPDQKVPRSPKEAAEMRKAANKQSSKPAAPKQSQQPKTEKAPAKYSPEASFLHYKAEGNRYLRGGEVIDAIRSYGMAIAQDSARAAPYINRALAHIKLKQYINAVADCTRGLQCADCDQALTVKALYRRGKAQQQLGDLERYKADLRHALSLEPHNSTIASELGVE